MSKKLLQGKGHHAYAIEFKNSTISIFNLKLLQAKGSEGVER